MLCQSAWASDTFLARGSAIASAVSFFVDMGENDLPWPTVKVRRMASPPPQFVEAKFRGEPARKLGQIHAVALAEFDSAVPLILHP